MSYRDPNELQNATRAPNLDVGSAEHHRDELLGGRYRVISFLGRGGMGVVYKVEQIFLGKELALKTIDRASQSDIAVRRFQAEARAVFAVNHPNIVSVHDFGLLDDQTPFLAMEFVQGQTLGDMIKVRTLPTDDALKIFIQVCFGLAHAHKNGVVHRDIKPTNIMILDGMPIGTEGSVKILDFGIAKLTQHDGGEIQALTKTGEIFGSPIYMSPEQCTGEKIDHRSDIYSLGCVIFEALTGTPPFVGESALSTMMMHQTASVPSLKEASLGTSFSPDLERVVQTMLSKNPNDRYQDLGIAAHDLAAIKSGQTANLSIGAKPTRVVKNQTAATISMRRHHFIFWIAGVAVISTAITFLAMQMWFLSQQSQSRLQSQSHQQASPQPAVLPDSTPIHSPVSTFESTEPSPEKVKAAKHFNVLKPDVDKPNKITARAVYDDDMRQLANVTDLQDIEFRSLEPGSLTDKGLSYLTNSKILYLTLQGEIENITNYTQLKYVWSLILNKSTISDAALVNIAKLPNLQSLNLIACKNISENGIRKLTQSKSLSKLILTKGGYSQAFIDEMHRKMPQCRIENYELFSPLEAKFEQAKGSNRYQKIAALYEEMKTIAPDSIGVASCLREMANIRSEQRRFSDAEKLWEQAIAVLDKNKNDHIAVHYCEEAAKCAEDAHHPVAAGKYTDRVVELLPATELHNNPDLYTTLAQVLQHTVKLGQWQKLLNHCDVGIKLADRFPQAPKNDDLCSIYGKAGDSCIYLKNPVKGLPYFEKLDRLANTGNPNKDYFWRSFALMRLGQCSPNVEERKKYYLAGMKLLEDQKLPDASYILNIYCDSCIELSNIYAAEHKLDAADAVLRKGLSAVEENMTDANHLDRQRKKSAFALYIDHNLHRSVRH